MAVGGNEGGDEGRNVRADEGGNVRGDVNGDEGVNVRGDVNGNEGGNLRGDVNGNECVVRRLGLNTVRESEAKPGFVSWIFAEAEDAKEDWWEKRKRNPKRLGELSQAAFLLKVQSMGFGLAVPWGDSEKWDFIVWAGPGARLLRVQVKATGRLNGGGYDVQPVYATRDGEKKWYTKEDIDVLAAHVVMEDRGGEAWYLLPVKAVMGVKNLRLFPEWKGRNPRWERYREAWKWLGRDHSRSE